jgi:tetratricopeptide (TPR) repeat protein
MWIGIINNPTIMNNNLIILESIIVSFSTFLIIMYYPRKWKKNISLLKPYKDELKIDPSNIVALNNMGVELTYQKRFNQAIKCFNRVLELNPEDSAALYNKSILYAKKGNYRNMEYLNKALKTDPNLENAEKLGKLILEYYKEDFIKK